MSTSREVDIVGVNAAANYYTFYKESGVSNMRQGEVSISSQCRGIHIFLWKGE
jgi:hypothetical protein